MHIEEGFKDGAGGMICMQGKNQKQISKISKKSKKNIRETDGQIMDTCHGIGGPTLMVKLCLNLSSKLCSFHSEPISNANKKKRTNTWLLCVGS